MSTILLPGPSDNPADTSGSASEESSAGKPPRGKRRSRAQNSGRIPSADDCLRLLHQLGGAVAMSLITPQQAGVLRSIYQAILQDHRRQATSTQHVLGGAEMLEKLRRDPDLANSLAPFLTDEQLAGLLADDEEKPDGSV